MYESMAIRVSEQMDSSACKNDFWGFEVVSRGNRRFIFWDNSRTIITTLSDTDFSVDTIIHSKLEFLPFTGLQNMEIEQMSKIAHCFKALDIQRIRGFDTDTLNYLECIINEDLTLYYVPEMQKNNLSKRNWFIDKTYKINENYFYYVQHKN
jgi:hypothetical protein